MLETFLDEQRGRSLPRSCSRARPASARRRSGARGSRSLASAATGFSRPRPAAPRQSSRSPLSATCSRTPSTTSPKNSRILSGEHWQLPCCARSPEGERLRQHCRRRALTRCVGPRRSFRSSSHWTTFSGSTPIGPGARVCRPATARRAGAPSSWHVDSKPISPLRLDSTAHASRVNMWRSAVLSLGACMHCSAIVWPNLPAARARRLHEVSGGNPFFRDRARSCRRRLRRTTGGHPAARFSRRPRRPRLTSLSPAADSALSMIALAAAPDAELIERAGYTAGVDEAAKAGLLELTEERIRFVHPLLGGAVLRRLDPGERRIIHRTLARLVSDDEERALHLASAAEGPMVRNRRRARGGRGFGPAKRRTRSPRLNARARDRACSQSADCRAAQGQCSRDAFLRRQSCTCQRAPHASRGDASTGPLRARALWRLGIARGELEGSKFEVELLQQALAETATTSCSRPKSFAASQG